MGRGGTDVEVRSDRIGSQASPGLGVVAGLFLSGPRPILHKLELFNPSARDTVSVISESQCLNQKRKRNLRRNT